MQTIEPFEFHPGATGKRGWAALVWSLLFHTLVLLLLILRPPSAGTTPPREPVAITNSPDPIPLPPLKQERSAPPAKPAPPIPQTPLGPDSKRPDAPVPRDLGVEQPPDLADNTPPKPADPVPPAPPPPPAEPTPPLERHLIPRPADLPRARVPLSGPTSPWGPPVTDLAEALRDAQPAKAPPEANSSSSANRAGLASRDNRDWQPSFPERARSGFDEAAGRCVEIPDLGKNPDGTPVLATVLGRVLDTGGRTPLPGAHLQIVGTSFVTFSDARGEYRLEFDPKLLERCRVQYVRVVAEGYASQLLTLSIGPRVRSDDVRLRRK